VTVLLLLQNAMPPDHITIAEWTGLLIALGTLITATLSGVALIIRELKGVRKDVQENTTVSRLMNGSAADAAVHAQAAAKAAEKVAVVAADELTKVAERVEDIAAQTQTPPHGHT
jgi:hypothetical protein